jgi:hypothetical protein
MIFGQLQIWNLGQVSHWKFWGATRIGHHKNSAAAVEFSAVHWTARLGNDSDHVVLFAPGGNGRSRGTFE